MTDIEKVHKGLECLVSMSSCIDCPYENNKNREHCLNNIGKDVIKLLKEQQNRIEVLRSEVKRLDVDIVRCKDCKHNNPFGCDKHNVIVSDIYFCADGERK